MLKTPAYAAAFPKAPLAPFTIWRREPRPHDVLIEILYCGVCHSDIHQVRNEWGDGIFPMVPGHEIIGRITRVGEGVSTFEVGDMAGVGTFVDSCRVCEFCRRGGEQFCEKGPAFTYNSTEMDRKTPTYGGYSSQIVVDERYTFKVPAGLDPARAAPLMCAGITTYSALRQWGCKDGDRVGVMGLGGLGYMAIKLAASMGAEVTVLSTSRAKEADARRLGARAFELSTHEETFRRLSGRFHMIVDTVSAKHDYDRYLALLRPYGAMVMVGMTPDPAPVSAKSLVSGNKRLAGSMVGGIPETRELLRHCAHHGIVADIEIIPIQQINEAYERVTKGDVRYRFVIDLATLERA